MGHKILSRNWKSLADSGVIARLARIVGGYISLGETELFGLSLLATGPVLWLAYLMDIFTIVCVGENKTLFRTAI